MRVPSLSPTFLPLSPSLYLSLPLTHCLCPSHSLPLSHSLTASVSLTRCPSPCGQASILSKLPVLIGELRAACVPLLGRLHGYVAAGVLTPIDSPTEQAAQLLRAIVGCLWGMLSYLSISYTALPAAPGMVRFIRQLLLLSSAVQIVPPLEVPRGARGGATGAAEAEAEGGTSQQACANRISKLLGSKMLTFALGMLGALDFAVDGDDAPAQPTSPPRLPSPHHRLSSPQRPTGAARPAGETLCREEEGSFDRTCEMIAVVASTAEPEPEPEVVEAPPPPPPPPDPRRRRRRKADLEDAEEEAAQAAQAAEVRKAKEKPLEPPKEEVHGQLRGPALKAVRKMAESLLGAFEGTMGGGGAVGGGPKSGGALPATKAAWRLAECYAGCLAALGRLCADELRAANAVDRLLHLLTRLSSHSAEGDGLVASGRTIHALMATTLLAIVSHRHPALRARPPPPPAEPLRSRAELQREASAVGARGAAGGAPAGGAPAGGAANSTSPPAAASPASPPPFMLDQSQLGLLVGSMHLSAGGSTSASAILWLQACSGQHSAILGVEAIPTLCTLFNTAVLTHGLAGGYGGVASWIAAALWRLCSMPSIAALVISLSAEALLASISQKTHDALRTAVLGCISTMLNLYELVAELAKIG